MANKKSIPEPENNKKDLGKEAAAAAKTTKDTGKKSSKKEESVDDFVAEQKASNQKRKQVYDEVVLIITGLIGILIYLSFMDACGIIGKGIKNLLFGLLGGILPYVFPIALFGLVFYVRKKPDDPNLEGFGW